MIKAMEEIKTKLNLISRQVNIRLTIQTKETPHTNRKGGRCMLHHEVSEKFIPKGSFGEAVKKWEINCIEFQKVRRAAYIDVG